MGELLDVHIEVHAVSPELLQRSYEVYLQQFDPYRLYLLESEVRPFLEPTPAELEAALARYESGDLSDYARLDAAIQTGIQRARSWRPALKKEAEHTLVDKRLPPRRMVCAAPLYCQRLEQLKHRQCDHMVQFAEHRLLSTSQFEPIEQTWQLYDKQARQRENPYLYQDGQGAPFSTNATEHILTVRTLKALAQSLDSHTAYYSPAEAYQLRMQLLQQFTGVGLELEDAAKGVVISRVLDGGSAAKSGRIQSRDRIVEINGESIEAIPYGEVMVRLHGPRGSQVELGIERAQKFFTVTLERQPLTVTADAPAATYQYFGKGVIGLIRLDSFYEGPGVSADRDIRRAIRFFREQGDLEGLVLDLRLNLGGFLSQAVKVAGLFVTNGVIAISKYGDGVEVFFRDVEGQALYDGPMVVLTSKASASAAEIVAQALQDYGQALIVGDPRTYGKGSIQHQTVTDETAEDFYKVTVGRYYTVSGRSTQVNGVKADIVVPTILYKEPIGEEYLEYPLEPDQIEPAFEDSLEDLDPFVRQWFIKYYLPTLQQRSVQWEAHLPRLRKNSEHRLNTSQNFRLFLQTLDGQPAAYGRDDLQLQESVNILKDMIHLQTATP